MGLFENYSKKAETLCFHSLAGSLAEQKCRSDELTKIVTICCDLKRTQDYLNTPDIKKHLTSKVPMEIYGAGEIPEEIEGFEKIRFHKTSKRYNEHFTLIEFENKPTLLWYEPYHELLPYLGFLSSIFPVNLIGAGSYLIKPDEKKIEEIKQKFNSL